MREPRRLTIAVPAPPTAILEAERLARIAEEIRRMPGVVGVREVPVEELLRLLPPGLVTPGPEQAAPLPRLLDVGFSAVTLPELGELAARLAAVAPRCDGGRRTVGRGQPGRRCAAHTVAGLAR